MPLGAPPSASRLEADVAVIMVLHNSGATVAQAVASVPVKSELVVVDNASDDDGLRRVIALRPDARLLQLDANLGFGAACNRGAHVATRDVLLFLNPDAVLAPTAVTELADTLVLEPSAIVGPAYFSAAGNLVANCRRRSRPIQDVIELLPSAGRWTPQSLRRDVPRDDLLYRRGGPVAYVQGTCFALRRSAFALAGGFDEDFFLYAEEEVLANRVAVRGGRSLYVPAAHIVHHGGVSTMTVASFAAHHHYRSRIIFYAKRDGFLVAAVTALAIAAAAILRAVVLSLSPARAKDTPLGSGRRWLRAVISGLSSGLDAAQPRSGPSS